MKLTPDMLGLASGMLVLAAGRCLTLRWCRDDVRARCRRPLLVCLAVALSFPLGPFAWIAFRPEPITAPKDEQRKLAEVCELQGTDPWV